MNVCVTVAEELEIMKVMKGGNTSKIDEAITSYTEERRFDIYNKNNPDKFNDKSRRAVRTGAMAKSASLLSKSLSMSYSRIPSQNSSKEVTVGNIKTSLDSLPMFTAVNKQLTKIGKLFLPLFFILLLFCF